MSVPDVQNCPATPSQVATTGFNLQYFFSQWSTLAQVINNHAQRIKDLFEAIASLSPPTPPTPLARVTNANGSYVELTDGTLFEWGQSGAIPMGGNSATIAVIFPKPFTTIPTVVTNPDNSPDGTNSPLACRPTSITLTGFTAVLNCTVIIGGSGATGITQVIHVNWHANGW